RQCTRSIDRARRRKAGVLINESQPCAFLIFTPLLLHHALPQFLLLLNRGSIDRNAIRRRLLRQYLLSRTLLHAYRGSINSSMLGSLRARWLHVLWSRLNSLLLLLLLRRRQNRLRRENR